MTATPPTTVNSGQVPDGSTAAVPAGRVRLPSGTVVDESTARRIGEAVPANTRRARESATDRYAAWCLDRGVIATDPGALLDWAGWLADRQYGADVIASYTTAVRHGLALSGHPLSKDDSDLLRAIISARAMQAARDPHDTTGDALQATECTREDLAAMVAGLDRTTVRGILRAWALLLTWHMSARASEPTHVWARDVREVTARYAHLATGAEVVQPALEVILRHSKTNAYGRTYDRIRLLAQPEPELCPVRAYRAWRAVLAEHGQETAGPILRRIDRWGNVGGVAVTAGRRPAGDDDGGMTDRTLRNVIARAARRAGLVEELTEEQQRILSTAAENTAAAAAATPEEAEEIRASWRRARRELRRRLPRFSGHSMRRGWVRHAQRSGAPREHIELHARYGPGSRALARYLDDLIAWQNHPTVTTPPEGTAPWWLAS